MKKTVSIFMLFALALVSTTVWAESLSERIRASKNNVTKEVNVGGFDAVCLNGSSKIIYTQTSGKQELELSVPDNLQDIVQVYVKNRTLIIELKKGYSVSFENGASLELRVAAPMVRSAVINGSGDIIFENGVDVNHGIDWTVNGSGDIDADKVKCRKMNVAVNGSGDIALGDVSGVEMNMAVNGSGDVAVKSISADRVNSAVNGSGDVTLSGKCTKANYSLSGSGDIAGSYLKAKQATVYTSPRSTGDISCYASEKIIINKEGKNSDVSYSGNPRTVEKNSTKGRHHRHSNDD
ncbi:GIN domain-containing protein [Phocaeicola massiliensis]|jgi:hypothetical protein|uniref:GIN domain-containing protein n=1 Tax=Phocaeicola massiliensis TaxID=204516 RepID=UPI00189987B4|nr:DUF2807 domain-containing protein [Phocaeicola massiliensis]